MSVAPNADIPDGKSVDYVIEFNATLRSLTLMLTLKFPNDPDMARAQKRILLAVRDFPVWVIEDVGKHMYKYREPILADDAGFFLENDYDAELRKAEKEDPEKAKLTASLIPRLKDAWQAANEGERVDLAEKAKALLYSYMDYRILKRVGR